MFDLIIKDEEKLVKAVQDAYCGYADSDIRFQQGKESVDKKNHDLIQYQKAREALRIFREKAIHGNILS